MRQFVASVIAFLLWLFLGHFGLFVLVSHGVVWVLVAAAAIVYAVIVFGVAVLVGLTWMRHIHRG